MVTPTVTPARKRVSITNVPPLSQEVLAQQARVYDADPTGGQPSRY